MSKIEIGRYSELLRRMLGQKGQEMVAPELSPEVSPTIQLEGTTPEWDFLKSVRRCGVGTRLAAAVGFTSVFRIRNPLTSGIIATVDLIETSYSTAGLLFNMGLLEIDASLPLPSSSLVMDQRWGSLGAGNQTALIMSADNTTAVFTAGRVFVRSRTEVNSPLRYKQGVVLPPGFAIVWGSTTLNIDVSTFVSWRERGVPLLEL